MGHSNTTEASQSYLYKNDAFSFFFLVNWVLVRIEKQRKSVIVNTNQRALETSKTWCVTENIKYCQSVRRHDTLGG